MIQAHRLLVATLTTIALTTPGLQASKEGNPAETRASDSTLYRTLKEVINRGADLYNGGDPAACYRLFEGALMTLRPQLDHRPELQKNIVRGLASAERDPVMWRRAFTLRSVLDKVRAELNPDRKESERLAQPKSEEEKKAEPPKPGKLENKDEKPASKDEKPKKDEEPRKDDEKPKKDEEPRNED